MARVVFYTRPGCHLCDDAIVVVERARLRVPFELAVIDIDVDESAREKYWDKIPVVEVDGRVHAKYRVDEAALLRRLGAP